MRVLSYVYVDYIIPAARDEKEADEMDAKEKILSVMKSEGKPISAGEAAKLSGLDKAEVDKAFKELKAEGKIVSPVRCKWEPAE